jgi:hypothetical protein
MMLIHYDSPAPEHMWTLDDENPVGDSIIDCKDWETVLAYLRKLFSLPRRS